MGNMYASVKTWNPFVGCQFGCIYCVPSFQRMVKRVYFCQGKKCLGCRDFAPHEHPERIDGQLPPGKTIWCCAHGDISFARPEYVRQVISRIKDKNFSEVYWQSKNPSCFQQYLADFTPNTILLTTLETNRDQGYAQISKAPLPSVRAEAFISLPWNRKMLTIEPVLDFDPEIFIEWIVKINPMAIWIGYNSKKMKMLSLPEPELDKLENFIKELEKRGFEIRRKTIRQHVVCSSSLSE
jgi:hypothetical protein